MIDDAAGRVEYDESGEGPAVVFVPGSCSTGAAWRPVIAAMGPGFRCVTTSLLAYGGTAERRSGADVGMAHEVAAVEAVVRRAGGAVHLVGHSFGGLVAVAVALEGRVELASLVVLEAPAMELLRDRGEEAAYAAFRGMTDGYFAAFARGEVEAIAGMVDFYGGAGTFAGWPERVRGYAVGTTAVNVLDWRTAYGFPLEVEALAGVGVRSLVVCGGDSHAAVRRANGLLAACLGRARMATVEGAAHFLIATHAAAVAGLVAAHVRGDNVGV